MKVRYTGEFTVSRPPEEVYRFLVDPNSFARAFPGFKGVDVNEDGSFTIRLRLSLGPLRGDARVKARIVEAEEPRRAKVKGSGQGAGSTLDFTLEFSITPEGGGSRVAWEFQGDVGGIAASMGARVLDPMARRMIRDVVDGIKRELESTE